MKMDFAMRTLFVVDLWLAMSVITSIILETTLLQTFNGLISICIFVGAILINVFVCLGVINYRNGRFPKEERISK